MQRTRETSRKIYPRVLATVLLTMTLALLSACGSSGTQSSTPSVTSTPAGGTVQVTLLDTKIESSRKTFLVGKPYDFVITNKGKAPHDFIISMGAKELAPSGSPDKILYVISSIPPQTTRNTRYVFSLVAPDRALRMATQLAGKGVSGIFIPIQATQ